MNLRNLFWSILLSTWVASAAPLSSPDQHFATKVMPLLEARCISCHGPDKVKGGLRLDSREAILKGGDNGPALIPGKPAESLLLQAVLHAKKDLEMPPREKMTPSDIGVLRRWIEDGAPWPASAIAANANEVPLRSGETIGNAWSDPRNPITRIFHGQRLDLWSVKPIRRPAPPTVRHPRWIRNSIDEFVLAQLEKSGLKPSPEADRRTLARRLYFDLTGLPPTPQEMDAFVNDRRPAAYEALVDRLLDSPRYGEHTARQWMDVIRYSDSNGFDWDEFRPLAWRFRDYLVRSFNSDKPFDQMIREQLAGDELLDGPPNTLAEQDELIATGYLRLGPHDNSAPLFNEQARSRSELMVDLVETTSSAFLGLTMGCCRCHDHKFDPLSQSDHFRMRAFFEGVKFADDLPLDLASRQNEIRQKNKALDHQLKPLKHSKEKILADIKARVRAERIKDLSESDQALLASEPANRSDPDKKRIEELEKKITPESSELIKHATEEEKTTTEDLAKQIAALNSERQKFEFGLLMTDAEAAPPVTKILYQGDYKQERAPVVPGFISILDPNPARIQKPINPKTTGRRLTLANWITSPENPLTTRVLVNRIWQSHFGEGLVATPNDFGLSGARPTHPLLLDWLATEFVRQKWSLKQMHKLIVMSATYRQASTPPKPSSTHLKIIRPAKKSFEFASSIDAHNELLWRQNIRRLSAEQLRDSLLFVSGKLTMSNGGPPIWPELPPEILTANPALLDDNETKTKGWYPSPAAQQDVRSIFLVQKRTVRIPFMETFDLPENATSCPRRNESIVAPQALSLLNGTIALESARALAEKIQYEVISDTAAQVKLAFQLALERPPDLEESKTCQEFLRKHGLKELCRALLNLNEFAYID